jgi:haloalkane dehalogenase
VSTPAFVRAADDNFAGLAEFPFAPHYLDVDGLRMHYVDEGPAGVPVALMVHGMPTWSYLYRTMITALREAGYRCVAPDHIGFGRSDKVTDASWYSIARHRANLTTLIECLDLHDITLFAQDWGGPIGLAQVVDMPERFSRLVVMNTWLHHDGYEYTPAIRNWIAQNQPGGLLREHIPSQFGWGTVLVIGTRRADPGEALLPALQGDEPALSADAEAVRAAYDAPFQGLGEAGVTGPRQFPLCIPVHDHRRGDGDAQAAHFRVLNETSLPVHFVWGGADDVFPAAWGRRWHDLISHSTWDEIADASHFLQDTHGAHIARIVLGHTGSAMPGTTAS